MVPAFAAPKGDDGRRCPDDNRRNGNDGCRNASGEHPPATLSLRASLAVIYLIIFGSLVGFTSYLYLLQRVSPALATSYGYINPAVAVILGIVLGGEAFTTREFSAMAVILAGVVLVMFGSSRK